MHLVEHRPHNVETAREARAGVHDEQPDAIAHRDFQGVLLVLERTPVEHHVARLASEGLGPVGLTWQCAVAALHVELALDDDEFLVRLARPTVPRVHDDRQVHPLHQVMYLDRKSTRLNSSHANISYA